MRLAKITTDHLRAPTEPIVIIATKKTSTKMTNTVPQAH